MVNCATYGQSLTARYLTRLTVASLLAVSVFVLIGPHHDAVAGEPVALIVGVDGTGTEPQVTPYTEITDGTTLHLAPDTRLTFLHYQRCEEVIVENGALTLRAGSFRLIGGEIVDQAMRGCPPTGDTVSEYGLGGVLFRGQTVLQVSPSSVVVVAGAQGAKVSKARIRPVAGGPDATVQVVGRVLDLQAFGASFRVGQEYGVELFSADDMPVSSFMIAPNATSRNTAVIRVD